MTLILQLFLYYKTFLLIVNVALEGIWKIKMLDGGWTKAGKLFMPLSHLSFITLMKSWPLHLGRRFGARHKLIFIANQFLEDQNNGRANSPKEWISSHMSFFLFPLFDYEHWSADYVASGGRLCGAVATPGLHRIRKFDYNLNFPIAYAGSHMIYGAWCT